MATRRKVIKPAPVRRKAADPVDDDDITRDMDNPGNPAELQPGEGSNDAIIKGDDFEPKPSMVEAAKAFGNLKAIKDYFGEGGEGDLAKMDHPGMREGLKAMCSEGGPVDSMMQSLKDLLHEHHGEDYKMEPDDLMQKSVDFIDDHGAAPYDEHKDVTPEGAAGPAPDLTVGVQELKDEFLTGEDNLVGNGNLPESDLDPLDEGDEEKQHGSDADTEEIIGRYKKGGQWHAVAGRAWRAKNGKIYTDLVSKSVEYPDGSTGHEPYGKDLTDPGNPAEFNTPPETGAIIKDEHLDAIGKAAEHLEAAAADPATPPMHKSAHMFHAKALHEVHEDLTNRGNPDELERPHKDGPGGPSDPSDLTAGVRELKDAEDNDFAKMLAVLRGSQSELHRKARMNGVGRN